MNKIYRKLILLFLLSIPLLKDTIEIQINSKSDYIKLSNLGIELDHYRTNTLVHAYATDKEINILRNNGFEVNKIINQAYEYYIQLKENERNPLGEYHNYNELTDFLNSITSTYPNITSLESIGQSVQGRELWVLRITDNPIIDEPEPQFKYIANMHGDETPGRELSLYLIEWLCENYNLNNRATNLVNNTDIFIMPSMNPDGFEAGSRYNANGVDLNRDFPDQYNDINNIIDGREPETQAVMTWSNNHNFTLAANMHSGALVVNYPFDGPQTGVYSSCPDDNLFINLSSVYADAHADMLSGGFPNGITNGSEWYSLTGGMQDWNYIWTNNLEITLEQSVTKWPNENTLNDLWNDNKESMIAYIEQIHTGVKGFVSDVTSGQALPAMITVSEIDRPILNHENFGDYYRLLNPGTYEITASSFGYMPSTKTIIISDNSISELNFKLYPATGIIEDFETGDLDNLDWNSNNNSWVIDNNNSVNGLYSIKAGAINSNESSVIELDINIPENSIISFYKKISCEHTGAQTGNYYDYLKFSIDNIEQKKWAGETSWSFEQFNITAGDHMLKWEYIKDGGVDSGFDTAWIDYIMLPNTNNNISGDINNDGLINIIDIVQLVDIIINNQQNEQADLNSDNTINVLDIITLVNIILN
tara:strand:- start:606 stop:2552 length:1947 start_codon:yes stop_codon:yes gene_type:complete